MSVPKKHHYLPEFFMQRWADESGRVTEYRRPREKLVVKQRHPAGTGYVRELYANTNKADPAERQALEMLFMQKVDGLAADALAYLEQHGVKPGDPELRSAWSRFLLSLMHRSPERMKYLMRRVREWEEGELNPDLRENYPALRAATDPATFEDWLAERGPVAPDLIVKLLPMLIDSENIGPVLNNMLWVVIEVNAGNGFITGDMPIMIANGLGERDGFVMVAVGPSRLFIAAHDLAVLLSFTTQTGDALQMALNEACARQSRHVIVARGEAHEPLVDGFFLRGPPLKANLAGLPTWAPPLVR